MSWTAPPAPADDGIDGTLPQIRQMSRGPPVSEPTVHTYRAADAGLWVNSYLVETWMIGLGADAVAAELAATAVTVGG